MKKSKNIKSEAKEMSKKTENNFRLVVFKANAYGSCSYAIPVASIEEASMIYNVLSLDDLIEEKMGVNPDYIGSISLEMYHSDLGWVDALDENGYDIEFKHLCNKEFVTHMRNVYNNGEDATLEYSDEEDEI